MAVVEQLTSQELQQRWLEVTEDETLADYEGRAEIDAYGEVHLTPPPAFVHQLIANDLARQIEGQLGGHALVECPVVVDGVLIADVAWLGPDPHPVIRSPAAERPPLIVEVASPRNTARGLRRKAERYLAHGVEEVVLVELTGRIVFITCEGDHDKSRFGLLLALPANTYPL